MKLIGIAGRRRSGKDTAALALVEQDYTLIRFADPLKNMIRTLLGNAALTMGDIERIIEGDQKETPLQLLCGKTARYAMQTLGTEWGRSLIGEDVWIRIALSRASGLNGVVIPDVRFKNEADAIHKAGGKIIKIIRPNLQQSSADSHVSEQEIDEIAGDITLVNNATIAGLQQAIREAAQDL